jgi:hypothetical protein
MQIQFTCGSMKAGKLTTKALRILLALCLLGAGVTPSAADPVTDCCIGSVSKGEVRHMPDMRRDLQPQCSCCKDSKAPCCDVQQGSSSKVSQEMVFAPPRVEGPSLEVISTHCTTGLHPMDSANGFRRMAAFVGTGPPRPLFLINLSILC